MASSKEFVEYAVEQLRDAGNISYRFGMRETFHTVKCSGNTDGTVMGNFWA